MEVYKRRCSKCHTEIFFRGPSNRCRFCLCQSEDLLFTFEDTGFRDGSCRVLSYKKASELKVGDLYYHTDFHRDFVISKIKNLIQNSKPALLISLYGYEDITLFPSDMVYCVDGRWFPSDDDII